MDLAAVQAVIDSAKARGTVSLRHFIRERLPEATDAEVDEAVVVAIDIIETVPILLQLASREARRLRVDSAVQPVLEHVASYFIHPIDVIPEMTMGLAGLLDDAYLTLKVLQTLERGPQPLLDADLDYPVAFIRRLVGEPIGRRLDAQAAAALDAMSGTLARVWEMMAAEA